MTNQDLYKLATSIFTTASDGELSDIPWAQQALRDIARRIQEHAIRQEWEGRQIHKRELE